MQIENAYGLLSTPLKLLWMCLECTGVQKQIYEQLISFSYKIVD